MQKPANVGLQAHTNVIGVLLPQANARPSKPSASGGLTPQTAPLSGYYYETPSSLACVYGFITQTTGCNPANATGVITSSGPTQAIAIVDAYHNPSVTSDLASFASQFGLPAPSNFQIVYATGVQPPVDTIGWSLESSLDVEWAYAMSPNAKVIYLVEAASNYPSDLLVAVDRATSLVAAKGGGVVSMSWGASEFPGQQSFDSHFNSGSVAYVASAGDAPGVSWPSSSGYVISVGGTSISRNPANGNFQAEMIWQQTGAGISAYVTRPSYQSGLSSIVGTHRGVPDIAAVADPNTGVWVHAQYACTSILPPGYCSGTYWVPVGGTSAAAPVEAGVISNKNVTYNAVHGALTAIYNHSIGSTRDITSGSGNCGLYAGYFTATGWDLCSGWGSLLGSK
jgi:subtilase family serine protease